MEDRCVMCGKTTKEYLNEYCKLDKEINSLANEKIRLRRQAESIGTSFRNDGSKKHMAGAAKFEAAIDKLQDIDNLIDEKIDKKNNLRREIELAIEAVDDTNMRSLLRHKYINGYTFDRVAVEIGYSWRQTIRLHGDALRKVVIVCHIEK